MSTAPARALSNDFQDVRLISLASWSRSAEIEPRDPHGPYVVIQEGYDPGDLTMVPGEFILGRSGRWMNLSLFYRLPVETRRAEFIFGQVADVMNTLGALTSKIQVFRPGEQELQPEDQAATGTEPDELSEAIRALK